MVEQSTYFMSHEAENNQEGPESHNPFERIPLMT
jgi:hypothetical protein